MSQQKFHRGDIVRVADMLPQYMRHFPAGLNGVVEYSYEDRYERQEGDREPQYKLSWIDRPGGSAWYEENQLTLIEKYPHPPINILEIKKDYIEKRLKDHEDTFKKMADK